MTAIIRNYLKFNFKLTIIGSNMKNLGSVITNPYFYNFLYKLYIF